MDNSFAYRLWRENFPIALSTPENLEYYEKGIVELIISSFFIPSRFLVEGRPVEDGVFFKEDKIYVCRHFLDRGFGIDWFRQSVVGKKVFVEWKGNKDRMTLNPTCYQVGDIDEEPPDLHHTLNFALGEKTLADIMKNSFRYGFNTETNTFELLPEDKQVSNKYKAILRYQIFKEVGSDLERLADYGRLIYVILDQLRSTLTERQKEILGPLIGLDVSDEELKKIVDREIFIDKKKKEYLDKKR